MPKSSLATKSFDFGTRCSNERTDKIRKITIHHMAGEMDPVACARMHYNGGGASANYYIGSDGTICAGVDESRRAWTSSSPWNDHQAITMEVSNNSGAPNWTVSDKAYKSMIALCIDICKRYGITPTYTYNTDGSFTEHLMFVATACPGPYLHGKMKQIVAEVAAGLDKKPAPTPAPKTDVLYKVQIGAFSKKANATEFAKDAEAKGFDTYVVKVGKYWKVQIGAFSKYENAEALLKKAQAAGYKDAFIAEVKK